MKITILDLCVCDEDYKTYTAPENEVFEYNEPHTWAGYISSINASNLDGVYFPLSNIDKTIFIIDDGGELFRLKTGAYMNVCWRGSMCRVWVEDDEDRIKYFNEKLSVEKH